MEKIERCFWCGKPKDQSITEETEETINNSIINSYVPCDKCKETFANGIHVMGVSKEPIVDGMFPITKDNDNVLYPTGSMFISNDEFIKDILSDPSEKELLDNVLKERKLLLPNDFVEQIINDIRDVENEMNAKDVDNHLDTLEEVLDEEKIHDQSNEESLS